MARAYQNRRQAFRMAEVIAHRVCSDPVLWFAFRLTQGLGPSRQALCTLRAIAAQHLQ